MTKNEIIAADGWFNPYKWELVGYSNSRPPFMEGLCGEEEVSSANYRLRDGALRDWMTRNIRTARYYAADEEMKAALAAEGRALEAHKALLEEAVKAVQNCGDRRLRVRARAERVVLGDLADVQSLVSDFPAVKAFREAMADVDAYLDRAVAELSAVREEMERRAVEGE